MNDEQEWSIKEVPKLQRRIRGREHVHESGDEGFAK